VAKDVEPAKVEDTTYDNPSKKKAKTLDADPCLDKVVKRYEQSRDYVNDYYKKTWEDSWKAYNNQHTNHSQYHGVAKNYVPLTFTIVESIKANILGGEQRFEYFPTREDQSRDTKALNALVTHYWYTNNFPAHASKWIQDQLVLGTGFLWTFWDEKRGVVPQFVPLSDNFVDPLAKSYEEVRYAGFRFLTTLKELEEDKTWDAEKEEFVPRFKNLGMVKRSKRNDRDETDKETKDMLNGSTLVKDAKEEQVEVIYYVDKEKIAYVANRSVVILEEETPFQRKEQTIESFDDAGNPVSVDLPAIEPFLPFAPARNYIDGGLFYGRGDVEVILQSQELLNDTSSQKTDNLTYIVNKVMMIDPAYSDEGDGFDLVPGAKFFVPPGAVEWLNMQPIGSDADLEMNRIIDTMQRATAADEIIQGRGSGGRTTATEIRAQLAQAGTRFSIKLKNLEREGMKVVADNMFKLIQIYVDKEIAVRAIGDQGAEFHTFNPGEYLGDYEPRVMLDTTAQAVAEEEKQNAMMFFQLASQMPFVDPVELFKRTAEKQFGLYGPELDKLVQAQQPMLPEEGIVPNDEELAQEQIANMSDDEIAAMLAEEQAATGPEVVEPV